jgi:hypothetical protein
MLSRCSATRTIDGRAEGARAIDFGTRSSLFGVVILSKHYCGRRWTEAEWAALSGKRPFLVLHGMTPEEASVLRPGLQGYAFAKTDSGI